MSQGDALPGEMQEGEVSVASHGDAPRGERKRKEK